MQPRFAAALGGVVVLTALIVVAVAAARPLAPSGQAVPGAAPRPAHIVSRHDGLRRSGVRQELQPVHGHRPPERPVRQGRDLRRPDVSPEGGKPTLPWLARSWKWSNGNKTLTLQIAKGVKWSDGKALTVEDVVYSLHAGRQDKTMDILGFTRPETNIASVKAKGSNAVVINLKTPDSQFIAATLNGAFVSRSTSGRRSTTRRRSRTRTRSAPARSRGSPASRRRTTCFARTRTTGRRASR